jgi:hypothetical protein
MYTCVPLWKGQWLYTESFEDARYFPRVILSRTVACNRLRDRSLRILYIGVGRELSLWHGSTP